MSSIGPQLPPHLCKRKRTPEDDAPAPAAPPTKTLRRESASTNNGDEIALDDSDSDDVGPSAPPAPASRPTAGPSLPPYTENSHRLDLSGPDPGSRAVTPPRSRHAPTQAEVQPGTADSGSEDEDDYGPCLPTANARPPTAIGPSLPAPEAAPQRDSWMLAPPTSSGYSERDPTRLRNRKFASKPAPSTTSTDPPGAPSIWTETPEEKLRRLQDSVLGRSDTHHDSSRGSTGDVIRSAEQEERDRRIAASIEARRGGSLYDEHSKQRRDRGVAKGAEDDDPSKRAFDRDKDMALGGKIGTAQRRELVSKAANFGSRFQKGSYL